MKPVLVDIDVLVDFLRGDPRAAAFIETFSDRIILSSIVVAELFSAARSEDERAALDDFISLFPVVPVSEAIAKAGAIFRSDYGMLHGVSLAAAILAATVEAEGAELKTLNIRHYPMFEDLKPAWT